VLLRLHLEHPHVLADLAMNSKVIQSSEKGDRFLPFVASRNVSVEEGAIRTQNHGLTLVAVKRTW
jgi:hypothetical protein